MLINQKKELYLHQIKTQKSKTGMKQSLFEQEFLKLETLKQEFQQRAVLAIAEGLLTENNKEDWCFIIFEAIPLIYEQDGIDWFHNHPEVDILDVVAFCLDYEDAEMGTHCENYDSYASLVNRFLAYVGGFWYYQFNVQDFILDTIKQKNETTKKERQC